MGYNNLPFCDFVVWNPESMAIERYMFDEPYYNWLRTEMRRWYVTEFAPRAIMKEDGLLREGQIDPVEEISISHEVMSKHFPGLDLKLSSNPSPTKRKFSQVQQEEFQASLFDSAEEKKKEEERKKKKVLTAQDLPFLFGAFK
jgi:hypothetical protein